MSCPRCGHEQTCPCKSCQARAATDRPWQWRPNDFIACGACGFEEHCDFWLGLEYRGRLVSKTSEGVSHG